MFKTATVNDLIALKQRYQKLFYPAEHEWGLKQFGTLFCYDQMLSRSPSTVLEVGVGRNRFFSQNLAQDVDYWAIDRPGFYDTASFERAKAQRSKTTYVEGMMGDFSSNLPSNHFDAVFSISVLEHVPEQSVYGVCDDLYRVTAPGGVNLHTLDISPQLYETLGKRYLDGLLRAGFQLQSPPAVDYSLMTEDPILFEPLHLVFDYYFGKRAEPYTNPPRIKYHNATIAIIALKPQS